jgi:hypothetical protein
VIIIVIVSLGGTDHVYAPFLCMLCACDGERGLHTCLYALVCVRLWVCVCVCASMLCARACPCTCMWALVSVCAHLFPKPSPTAFTRCQSTLDTSDGRCVLQNNPYTCGASSMGINQGPQSASAQKLFKTPSRTACFRVYWQPGSVHWVLPIRALKGKIVVCGGGHLHT